MRKLVINTFVTVDGVMQGPGGPEEDPTGGFAFGGWGVTQWDEVMNEKMGASMDEPFALLLGRKTYEIFAAHWPHVLEEERAARGGTSSEVDDPAAAALNAARKYVASRTLDAVHWNNSVLLEGDVAERVAELKAEDGPEIQVHGSSDLIQTLLAAELVDIWRVWTFPVVLGAGKRLFGSGTLPTNLRLTDSTVSTTGVIIATYEPAGQVVTGSFAFDDPPEQELQRRSSLS
jgi:dihydrofolate reductase